MATFFAGLFFIGLIGFIFGIILFYIGLITQKKQTRSKCFSHCRFRLYCLVFVWWLVLLPRCDVFR